jgi:uncharacterized membrane protein
MIDGVLVMITLFFALVVLEATNPQVVQHWRSKSARVGSTMTTLVREWIPSLVNTMLTCQWEKWNVVKGLVCVIVLVTPGSQHLVQWQQKCHELHHGCLCIYCHGCNVKGGHM